MTESIRTSPTEATWFGQPRGLTILFLTQMWEIFSYYGMRTLLIYYMTKQLLFGQQHASLVYGTYVAMAYFTPILGGIVSDRWLGKRRAVIIGGSIMAIGHGLMAFDAWLYVALATIALGNGLFTPSLPSQITDLYKKDDPRGGRAFNIYYVGINLGGLLAPLVCGTLGELYGWHYGFAAAGVGMVVGLLIYTLGGRYLPASQPVVRTDPVQRANLRDYKPTLLLLLAVGLAVTVFRASYEQLGNTVALWIDSGVDRAAAGMVIPMTWFQSLNPLFVFLLTPMLLAVWRRRGEAGKEPASMRKMAIGALIIALAYVLLAVLTSTAGAASVAWWWLLVFFGLFTLGELYILPTGLGLFARLAPPGHTATTVAAWFLAIFSGSLAAGATGTLWSELSHAAFFVCLAGLALLAGVLLFLLEPLAARIEAQRAGSRSD